MVRKIKRLHPMAPRIIGGLRPHSSTQVQPFRWALSATSLQGTILRLLAASTPSITIQLPEIFILRAWRFN